MYYLYQHIRKDNDEVFYIGIGNAKRPYDKTGRNAFWNNVVSKTDYTIEVIKTCSTIEEVCDWEILFIWLYGKRIDNTGTLVNLTDGGEGFVGLLRTEEHKKNISNSMLGKQFSDEHKQRMRESRLGVPSYNKGMNLIDSHKSNISKSLIGLRPLGKNPKAKPCKCSASGKTWSCVKECWIELYSDKYSYSHFRSMIRNIKNNRTTINYDV